MQTLILVLLLSAVLAFFAPQVQTRAQRLLHRAPAAVWALPFLLTAIFSAASLLAGAFSIPLTLMVLAYTVAPVACAYAQGAGATGPPSALDFLAIALLWLPIEFGAGHTLIPRPAQGFLHSVAYGIAILLALTLFLGFRTFPGMKYNLPRRAADFRLPVVGFALVAPVLAVVGIAIGFIPWPHLPVKPAGQMAAAVGIIFVGTALPEEILFRSLIQNLIMLRLGASGRTLFLASFIFGCAHLDNGPQPLPNWRYMIVATIAGWAYGRVFERAGSVMSSAGLHMAVDWTKHFFF
jgi:membrane protease YdiL (CAAX protease family)